MYVPDIALHECESLEQAAALLSRYGADARLLAGGTDLLVDLKTGRTQAAHLVSLKRVAALRGVTVEPRNPAAGEGATPRSLPAAAFLRIAALTTVSELDCSPLVRRYFAPLRDATREMATAQVRNLASVGGNLASAVPCADLPPMLIAMHASIELWSAAGPRTVPLDEFFLGPRRTLLRPGEVLTAVRVPALPPGFGAAYARFALRNGNAIAVASVAASLQLSSDDLVTSARLVLGAVAPTPALAPAAAAALLGRPAADESFAVAAGRARRAAAPISDIRGSAEYRRDIVEVLTRRALAVAAQRARESRA